MQQWHVIVLCPLILYFVLGDMNFSLKAQEAGTCSRVLIEPSIPPSFVLINNTVRHLCSIADVYTWHSAIKKLDHSHFRLPWKNPGSRLQRCFNERSSDHTGITLLPRQSSAHTVRQRHVVPGHTHMILSRREGMVAVHYVSNSWGIQHAITTYRHTKRHLCYLKQRRLVDKDRSPSHDASDHVIGELIPLHHKSDLQALDTQIPGFTPTWGPKLHQNLP
ncbi:hypothetical protein KCU76_g41, partial [Aureobasidium melanogenum]